MYWTVQVSGQYEDCAVFNKSTNPEDGTDNHREVEMCDKGK